MLYLWPLPYIFCNFCEIIVTVHMTNVTTHSSFWAVAWPPTFKNKIVWQGNYEILVTSLEMTRCQKPIFSRRRTYPFKAIGGSGSKFSFWVIWRISIGGNKDFLQNVKINFRSKVIALWSSRFWKFIIFMLLDKF